MKKLLFTGLLLSLGVLAGCGGESAEVPEDVKLPALAADSSFDTFAVDADAYINKIGDYKGLELVATKVPVDDNMLDYYMSMYFGSLYTFESSGKDTVEKGDIVNIDYEGLMDNVAFDGGTAQNQELSIGSGRFIPGFEDGLIGHKKGEKVSLDLTFPENYSNEELAGAAVVFNVTINDIGQRVITDEAAITTGIEGVKDAEGLKNYLKDMFEESAEADYQEKLAANGMDQILAATDFTGEYPEGMVEYYKNQMISMDKDNADSYGIEWDKYITENLGTTQEIYDNQVNLAAEETAKQTLVILKIAKDEGIVIDDKEVEEGLTQLAANMGFENLEEMKKEINTDDYKLYMMKQKTDRIVIDNGKISE